MSKNIARNIRYAEISDLAQKLLNPKNTSEEDKIYYDVLSRVIKKENINLSAILLGRTQDGSKDITLADIWNSEGQKITRFKQ